MAAWWGEELSPESKGGPRRPTILGLQEPEMHRGVVSRFPWCRTGSRRVLPAACSIFLPPVG